MPRQLGWEQVGLPDRPNGESWELHLQVNLVNQVTITGNGASNFLSKVGSTLEGLFNCLNGKVSVTAIDRLVKMLSAGYP